MAEKINDGGPAFPVHGSFSNKGMSLRDWFAGQYLAGNRWSGGTAEQLAIDAYNAADAMLATRSSNMRTDQP